MSYVSNGKGGTVTDGDASGSVDGIGGVEVTGMSSHMRDSSSVHIPVTAAGVGGWRGSGVQGCQESRVPRLGWEHMLLRRLHKGQQRQPSWLRRLYV
jgi:hypothetical protein